MLLNEMFIVLEVDVGIDGPLWFVLLLQLLGQVVLLIIDTELVLLFILVVLGLVHAEGKQELNQDDATRVDLYLVQRGWILEVLHLLDGGVRVVNVHLQHILVLHHDLLGVIERRHVRQQRQ